MIDFLMSLEGLTTVIAFISTSWGLLQKFKERKARKEVLNIQREGQKQREKLLHDGRMERQMLLDEIQEIGERHERDKADTQKRFDQILSAGKEELATLRGQIGKLMDMIMSGEEIEVEPNGKTVSIKGVSGEVTMRTDTLNKVVEATTNCKYVPKKGMFNKGLERVEIDPDPSLEGAYSSDPADKG